MASQGSSRRSAASTTERNAGGGGMYSQDVQARHESEVRVFPGRQHGHRGADPAEIGLSQWNPEAGSSQMPQPFTPQRAATGGPWGSIQPPGIWAPAHDGGGWPQPQQPNGPPLLSAPSPSAAAGHVMPKPSDHSARDNNATDDDTSLRRANREAVKKYRKRKKEEQNDLLESVIDVRGQVARLEERIEQIRHTKAQDLDASEGAAVESEHRELRHLRSLKQFMTQAFTMNEDQESAC